MRNDVYIGMSLHMYICMYTYAVMLMDTFPHMLHACMYAQQEVYMDMAERVDRASY